MIPSSAKPPDPANFHLLTLLRGLAALTVVIFHLRHWLPIPQASSQPLIGGMKSLINAGWFGVDVFFLISGYGLAAKLQGNQALKGVRGVGCFAWNRFWRIYPLYWTCCLITLGLAWAASHFNHLDWHHDFPPDPMGVLASLTLLEPLTGTPPILPIVTWALSCELGFYALVALGIMLRPRLSAAALTTAAAALAFANLLGWKPAFDRLLTFWPEFACGLLVFAAVHQRTRDKQTGFRAALAMIVALGLNALIGEQFRIVAVTVLGLGLVAAQPFDDAFRRAGHLRWLTWCGAISYPLFLLHVPLMSRVLNLGRRVMPAGKFAFVPVIAAAFSLAILTAWAVQRWIGVPTRALAHGQSAPTT